MSGDWPSAVSLYSVPSRYSGAGDAASAYDPIGSAGITNALAHGIGAARAIEARLAAGGGPGVAESFSDYQRTVFADFTTHVKLRRELYSNETRWPDAPFWVQRCGGQAPGHPARPAPNPAARPVAQAHWKLWPPIGPKASSISPHRKRRG